MMPRLHDQVVLAHGGGGELTSRLVREHVLPHIQNAELAPLDDAAVLGWRGDGERVVFTTDSYVVTPLEFPGGDIGRLAVAGTVNDLAVMGATPVALSLGLILEEGLPIEVLERAMASVGRTAREAGVQVVTGDTKVIERRHPSAESGSAGARALAQMFINTAGVGRLAADVKLGLERIEAGDAILVTGHIAEHGLAIMSVRNGLEFESTLRSDVAPLFDLIRTLRATGADIKFLRDPTRGGVAGVVADLSERTGLSVEIEETRVPLTATARHAAEMLGLDPLTVANEGKVVVVVRGDDAERVLQAARGHALGRHAAIVGRTVRRDPPLVELLTRAGGRRIVQRPYGEDLPRIC